MFIADAAVNIYFSLEDKRDIVQNAIDLAHTLGIAAPKVAILWAQERVSAKLTSTLDAAVLCKMAERGQITGSVLDGPLGFDVAVPPKAARGKGVISPVAGLADIFGVPDLEAGNVLTEQLEQLADAQVAGVVLGEDAGHPNQPRRKYAGAPWFLRIGAVAGSPQASSVA